jgi:hypothetical protein
MGKTNINRDIQIFFLHKDIKKNNLNIKINELDSHSKNKNIMCLYYLSANSVEFLKNSITINEGVVHTMILNDKLDSVSYNYPYPFDDKFVSISLYKYYKGNLDIRVSINDKFTSEMITMKNIFYKKIVLYVNVLKKYCSDSENSDSKIYKDFGFYSTDIDKYLYGIYPYLYDLILLFLDDNTDAQLILELLVQFMNENHPINDMKNVIEKINKILDYHFNDFYNSLNKFEVKKYVSGWLEEGIED